jgi:Leucine-rich repeat (LRR) protein
MSDPTRLAVIFLAAAGCLGAANSDNRITDAGGVVDLDSSGQIVAVDLHASWATDSDIAELARLPDLRRLDLSLTRISDHGLRQLKGVPGITDLNLRYDESITDAGLSTVKGWRHLARLNLRGTKITDTTLLHLNAVTSLVSLDIGYAQITDVGLDLLTSLTNLKELSIGGNKLTDIGLQPLRQLPGLTYLDLGGAQRTDSGLWSITLAEQGLDAIATLKNLRRLRLNGTAISARGLARLHGLTKLESLDLEGCNRVGDDAVPVLASFPSLQLVDLSGTAVTEKGAAMLRRAKPLCKILMGGLSAGRVKAEEAQD